MKRYILTIWLILIGLCVCPCLSAPVPAVVQEPSEWTLEVNFEHPQQIMVRLAPNQSPTRFWYMIITVTNKTDSSVSFYPKCELMTDTFQIIQAGQKVRAKVFEQIRIRHKGKYPFLESLELVDNRILQGQDNTRDIAIIWPDFDYRAKTVKLFIAGLSNETTVIDHPTAIDENGTPTKVYLRKALELNYSIGGDAKLRNQQNMKFKNNRWIMR